MKHPRYGYEITPRTVEQLVESARAQQVAAAEDEYFDARTDVVVMTAEAASDLSERLLCIERQMAEVPAAIAGAIRQAAAQHPTSWELP